MTEEINVTNVNINNDINTNTNTNTINKTEYPKIQVLDNANKPVTPLVDVNSIYAKADTKDPVPLIYELEKESIKESDFYVQDASHIDSSSLKPNEYSYNMLSPNQIVIDANIDGHKLVLKTANMSEVLAYWYEHSYLQQKLGEPIYYILINDVNSNVPTLGDTKWKKLYAVQDYNTLDIALSLSNSTYPKVGTISPSQDYLVVSGSTNDIDVYGFSGDDTPQKIEMKDYPGNNAYQISINPFGITSDLTNPGLEGGLEYHIIFKRKNTNQY